MHCIKTLIKEVVLLQRLKVYTLAVYRFRRQWVSFIERHPLFGMLFNTVIKIIRPSKLYSDVGGRGKKQTAKKNTRWSWSCLCFSHFT